MDKVKRWSEGKKEYVMVDRSFCVCLYNKDMGSVDNNDRMIAYYRIKAKTKKWLVRVILRIVVLALVNS